MKDLNTIIGKRIGIVGTGSVLAAAVLQLRSRFEEELIIIDSSEPDFKDKAVSLNKDMTVIDLSDFSVPPLKIEEPPIRNIETTNIMYGSDEYNNRSGKRAKIKKTKKRSW